MIDQPVTDARLVAPDAHAAARRRMSRNKNADAGSAVMAAFVSLALAALFAELVAEPERS